MHAPFWNGQVRIEVSGHQQLGPSGLHADGHDNVLYGGGVFKGDITPHNMTPLPPHHQLEADGVRDVESERLQREVLHLVVEDRDATDVQARRRRCCDAIPAQLPHKNPPRDLRLLEDSKFDIPL